MYCVLEKEIILSPKDEKTNVPIEFIIDRPVRSIKITYSYSPKELTDESAARLKIEQCLIRDGEEEKLSSWREFLPILNLVTLSLDDPYTFRGAAHRHAYTQEHIISENEASHGFIKGKIHEGKWILQLNVHALVTQECICRIKIEAQEADYE